MYARKLGGYDGYTLQNIYRTIIYSICLKKYIIVCNRNYHALGIDVSIFKLFLTFYGVNLRV